MTRTVVPPPARLAAAAAVAVLILLGIPAPASAHVLLARAQPNGDGTTTLTFTFDHGCGDSPTTELSVTLPAGVTATTVTQPPGWTARQAADRIAWTGPGLAPGSEAAFTIITRIVGTVGQAFRFPTEQRCADGNGYEWSDAAAGDEHPAPTLIATRSVLAAESTPAAQPPAAQPATGGAGRTAVMSTIAGFVALAAAVGALTTRRARP